MKKSTIFFGASSYVLPVIDFLNKNYNLQLVVTTEQNATDPVPAFCKKHTIPYVSVTQIDDSLRSKLLALSSSFAVLADFRLMVRKNVLDIFPKGIINIHPSLLPKYRGPTPGLTAILDGKKESGVSLMLLNEKMDEGAIIGQIKLPILPTDTSPTLYTRYFSEGTKLLERELPDYLDGKAQPTEQDNSKATYTDFLKRESGFFDSTNPSEKEIFDRKVRAYHPWPSYWTRIKLNKDERIVKFLPEEKIQVEGKKPQSYKDFLNGYPQMKDWLEKITYSHSEA